MPGICFPSFATREIAALLPPLVVFIASPGAFKENRSERSAKVRPFSSPRSGVNYRKEEQTPAAWNDFYSWDEKRVTVKRTYRQTHTKKVSQEWNFDCLIPFYQTPFLLQIIERTLPCGIFPTNITGIMIGALAIKTRRQQQLLKSKSTCSGDIPGIIMSAACGPEASSRAPPPPPRPPAKGRRFILIYICAGCIFLCGFVMIMPGIYQVKTNYFVTSSILMGCGVVVMIIACLVSELLYGHCTGGDHVEAGREILNQMRMKMNLSPLPLNKKDFQQRSLNRGSRGKAGHKHNSISKSINNNNNNSSHKRQSPQEEQLHRPPTPSPAAIVSALAPSPVPVATTSSPVAGMITCDLQASAVTDVTADPDVSRLDPKGFRSMTSPPEASVLIAHSFDHPDGSLHADFSCLSDPPVGGLVPDEAEGASEEGKSGQELDHRHEQAVQSSVSISEVNTVTTSSPSPLPPAEALESTPSTAIPALPPHSSASMISVPVVIMNLHPNLSPETMTTASSSLAHTDLPLVST